VKVIPIHLNANVQSLIVVSSMDATTPLLEDRLTPIEAVRRWGKTTSDALLDPSCHKFQIPSVKGFIGYRLQNGCAVVLGDPVCEEKDIPELVQAFHLTSAQQSMPVLYLIVSQSFAEWAMEHLTSTAIEFGKEMFLDPYHDPQNKSGTKASLVRRKVKHALKEGVTAEEYLPSDLEIERQIEEVGREWLKSRHGPQVHTSQIKIFDNRLGKRWFYARYEERIIGVLILNQIQVKQGALLNRYMVLPGVPGGVPELLISTAIRCLREEDCHFLSLGIVPSDKLGRIQGLNPLAAWICRTLFKVAVRLFRLRGHMGFWEKFQPEQEPCYILLSQPRFRLKELLALSQALNMHL